MTSLPKVATIETRKKKTLCNKQHQMKVMPMYELSCFGFHPQTQNIEPCSYRKGSIIEMKENHEICLAGNCITQRVKNLIYDLNSNLIYVVLTFVSTGFENTKNLAYFTPKYFR